MSLNYRNRYIEQIHIWEFDFKGSIYKVRFHKYDVCISIIDLLYICDVLDLALKPIPFKNIYLRELETEYKQIYSLISEELFKKVI